MTIKRIFNKDDLDLFNFRVSAIEECGGKAEHVNINLNYKSTIQILKIAGVTRIEDAYRFTAGKWNKTEFDFIDAHYSLTGEITNISGSKQYNQWMRGGMYHFGLRKYSNQYPSVLFQDSGHLVRLIEYCNKKELNGIFISIYPHENRLKALSRALKIGRSIPTSAKIELIRKLKYKGSYIFNNVLQDFFVLELKDTVFSFDDIL
jgi:hypothetical protein